MRIAHFDCPAGASGNMFLGACLDAGLDQDALEAGLRLLELPPWRLATRRVRRGTIAALHAEFELPDAEPSGGHPHRAYGEIDELIAAANIADGPKSRARAMFHRLAEVEGRVHDVATADVTFHEVGAVDSILDIVGAALAVELLELDEVTVSRINVGGGSVATQHGLLPVPAPATLRLLDGSGALTYSTTEQAELLTPTGALLLTSLASAYGPQPGMRIQAHGYGAGTLELDSPNILRVTIGDRTEELHGDQVVVVETNIDDMNPELYDYVAERLFESGALDVTTTPIGMKKGRPGTQLSAIVPSGAVDAIVHVLMRETTTLGVRCHDVRRLKLPRHEFSVDTRYGPVRVKVSYLDDVLRDVAPEAEDCRAAAAAHGAPYRSVYDAARSAGLAAAPRKPPMSSDREGAHE